MTNLTYSLPTAATNIQVWCVDAAGNTSATDSYTRIPPMPLINLTNGQIVSNTQTITGTADYPTTAASVWMSTNGGAYLQVTGTTNWTNTLSFTTVWSNTISVYTLDSNGNSSYTNTVSNIVTLPWVGTFANGLPAPRGIAMDSAGNIYCLTIDGIIYKYSNNILIDDINYGGTCYGIAIDSNGNQYFTRINQIIEILTNGSNFVFAGAEAASNADGTGTNAYFNTPEGIAIDSNGNIFVADHGNDSIRKITPEGVVTTFAGCPAPTGIALDASQNVYTVSGYLDNGGLIFKYTPAGVGSLLAGNSIPGYADGTGSAASFSDPWDCAIDSAGNVYVTDWGNQRIRKITPAGVVTTFAGTGTPAHADGTCSSALFNYPEGILLDSSGNIFVADRYNSCIRKITMAP
jgi:hypothetical protein